MYIYGLKPLLKTSKQIQETKKCFLFYSIIRHTSCFQSWLTLLQPSTQPNHPQCVLNCIIKTIPISQSLRLLKIANLILFSVFAFFPNLLSQCGDIEKNPGFQYSSLSFSHWNLNGLTAHDCIKPL